MRLDDLKSRLRTEILARRETLTTALRVIRSADILQRLFELDVMVSAGWIHFYVSYGWEVESTGMIAHGLKKGKRVAVPKMERATNCLVLSELKDPVNDLEVSSLGIPEPRAGFFRPVEVEVMDVMVVPGVAFDEKGNRLGQGAGYYDRMLAPMAGRIPFIGLAFEFQLVPEVPCDSHNVRMDWIVTEKKTNRAAHQIAPANDHALLT